MTFTGGFCCICSGSCLHSGPHSYCSQHTHQFPGAASGAQWPVPIPSVSFAENETLIRIEAKLDEFLKLVEHCKTEIFWIERWTSRRHETKQKPKRKKKK